MDLRRISTRILFDELILSGKVVTAISVYGHQSGSGEEEEDSFYDDPSAKMQSKDGICIVLEDLNEPVGSSTDEYQRVYGGQRWRI